MTTPNIPELIATLRHHHIVFPRDKELRATLDLSAEQMWVKSHPNLPWGPENRGEQKAIIVSGATGTDKTETIKKALELLTPRLIDPEGMPCRVVSVKVPSPYSAKELCRRVLKKLEMRMDDDLTEGELWEAVIENCAGHRVVLLHLDEFQRFTTIKTIGRAENTKAVERLAATLNELLMADEWPIALVISGTEEIIDFWHTDLMDQVHRRTKYVDFAQMSSAYFSAIDKALIQYLSLAGLSSAISVTDLAGRIAMAAEDTLGIALEIMQEAIVGAVREKSAVLTIKHFAHVYARRTKFGTDRNPFLVDDWVKIGVRQKLTLASIEADRKTREAAS